MLMAYGGGGSAPYVAKAVQFDGNTFLQNLSLISTDLQSASYIFWYKPTLVDLQNGVFPIVSNSSGNGVQLTGAVVVGPETYGFAQAQWSDGPPNFNGDILANTVDTDGTTASGGIEGDPDPIWNCIIFSGDMSGGTARCQQYLNDSTVTSLGPLHITNNGSLPFTVGFNGFDFVVGGNNSINITGALCDVRVINQSLLDGGGDIPLATRRKIIDANGKPVDPTVLTAFLGTPGIVLFSGDHTTFPVNQGTGGAFTLTGTLTDASTHP
jgi:hypothetical protein